MSPRAWAWASVFVFCMFPAFSGHVGDNKTSQPALGQHKQNLLDQVCEAWVIFSTETAKTDKAMSSSPFQAGRDPLWGQLFPVGAAVSG